MTDGKISWNSVIGVIGLVLTGIGLVITVSFGVYDRWPSSPATAALPPAEVLSNPAVSSASQLSSAPISTFSSALPPADPGVAKTSLSNASSPMEPRDIQPSFPCDLPATRYQAFEHAICNSPLLSGADLALEATYISARKRATIQQRAWLKTEQRSWMGSRSQCQDDECLLSLYQQRSAELTNLFR